MNKLTQNTIQRLDQPPDAKKSLSLLDNKTNNLRPLSLGYPENVLSKLNDKNISLAHILETEVNAAHKAGNQKLVDELNGIIICFMQLRNQLSQLLTQEAHSLEVVKVIKHKVLGMWNQ